MTLASIGEAKEITDIFGRQYSVPDRPTRVYSASPIITYMLYAIDPAILVGLNFPVREHEKRYLDNRMLDLPIVGGWFGQGQTPNLEMLLKVNPDLIVISLFDSAMKARIIETMKTLNMPVVNVTLDKLSDYPEAFLFLGSILGREARTKELSDYARNTITETTAFARKVPDREKITIYYAEGVDGLSTECNTSPHTELIGLAGGRNVHQCETGNRFGMEKVSLEQVLLYNPEVILVFEKSFYKKVLTDRRWQDVRAIRDGKVYLIPNEPFNWFDRPPSFMRLLGLKWLTSLLYPDTYRIDIVKETWHFFRLFLGFDLTDEEIRRILSP